MQKQAVGLSVGLQFSLMTLILFFPSLSRLFASPSQNSVQFLLGSASQEFK